MKIAITVGHSKLKNGMITSAQGIVNEYKWCRAFSKNLKNQLRKRHDVTLIICPERVFKTANDEKTYKLPRVNAKNYDLVIELHLNSSTSRNACGAEVLYKSDIGKKYAEKVLNGLGNVFTKRSVVKRDDLYMLNGTNAPCIMVEAFFCTSPSDYKKAKGLKNRRKIAKAIAKQLKGALK